MSDFAAAIAFVLSNEGVDSDDPHDSGGRTRFGITDAEAKRHGFDVRVITVDQAKAIYLADYWRFDGITDQRVATKLLDMAVNMGLGTAVGIAQRIVGVAHDGAMGPTTAAAINGHAPMISDLVAECVRRYAHIVAADHSQIGFLVGWMERALKVPALSGGLRQ